MILVDSNNNFKINIRTVRFRISKEVSPFLLIKSERYGTSVYKIMIITNHLYNPDIDANNIERNLEFNMICLYNSPIVFSYFKQYEF